MGLINFRGTYRSTDVRDWQGDEEVMKWAASFNRPVVVLLGRRLGNT